MKLWMAAKICDIIGRNKILCAIYGQFGLNDLTTMLLRLHFPPLGLDLMPLLFYERAYQH